MEKPLLLISFSIVFISLSFSVAAVDLSKTTGLSGSITSSYASYSVNFGDTYSSIGGVCFDFTFSGDLLDPKEHLSYSVVPAPAPNWYGKIGGTIPESTVTSCITPSHTGFNEFLDGTVTGSVWMTNGTVTLQSLTIRLTNAVSTTPTCPTCPSPTVWSTCVNNNQTRTVYKCDSTTNYQCKDFIEWQSCTSVVNQTCPICLPPTAWSACTNNQQSRTNYKCDSTTNYICQSYTETQSCISTSNVTCVDNDGGKAYFTASDASKGTTKKIDSCITSTTLSEAYCSNNEVSTILYSCGSGYECKDGACVSLPAPTTKPSMQIAISLPKTTYYPNENLEPKVTITDASGRLITNAVIKSNITGPKTLYPYFFYSSLCDCYKSYYWLPESALLGDHTLNIEASHPDFTKTTASAAFKVIKPTISTFTISTDKTEYSAGDTITATITATDSFGNTIKDLYITGELRDAETGKLISAVYPFLSGDIYKYTYYSGSESVGKVYKFVVSTTWKEQKASAEVLVSIVKKGLNADVVLENNVLSPKDSLRGRVKVHDKDGNVVTDAYVSINVNDPQGNYVKSIDTVYKDGFYEMKEWKVDEWVSVGTYSLEIKVSKYPEEITLEKSIEITKQKLNVEVILDKTSYKPGDSIYLKVLVTYPDGTIAKDAWLSAEIFPLTEQPFSREREGFYQLSVCRIYPSLIAPVYYKGQFIQKYFIDNSYIPSDCPTGTYALRLKVSANGYADSEIAQEFEVALAKLFIETGFSVDSQVDSVNLAIYADVKDENGKAVEFATIEGILRQPEEEFKGCVRRFSLYYDSLLKRYVTNDFVSRYECPSGNYIIQLKASSPSYETAEVVQGLTIQYKQGYEYRGYVPATPTESVCREVSCGPNCIEKVCESTIPIGECYNIVTDSACVNTCTEQLRQVEEAISRGVETPVDFEACIEQCTVQVPCQGAGVPVVPLEVMIDKLNELRNAVAETKEEVSGLKEILLAIIDFVNSILQKYLGPQETITVPSETIQNASTNQTNPVTGAFATLIKSFAR